MPDGPGATGPGLGREPGAQGLGIGRGPGAAVTGVGLFTPAGADAATTWETVRAGKPTAALEERHGLRYLACRAPELPGDPGRAVTARRPDRSALLGLVAAREALAARAWTPPAGTGRGSAWSSASGRAVSSPSRRSTRCCGRTAPATCPRSRCRVRCRTGSRGSWPSSSGSGARRRR
ncbi:hypothetical protein STANM309S_05266 [Streptomyces tanashiensis]